MQTQEEMDAFDLKKDFAVLDRIKEDYLKDLKENIYRVGAEEKLKL